MYNVLVRVRVHVCVRMYSMYMYVSAHVCTYVHVRACKGYA